jgi:hypothetical protein
MRHILTFAILSLFLPIRLNTGLVLLRPFELLAVLALMAGLATGRWRNLVFPTGFLLLLPFFSWHVISAFTVDAKNGFRELLQISAVTALAFALAQEAGRLEIGRAIRILLFCMVLILAYTIGWHLAHGYWVGWKHLPDPKLAFIFAPVTLAGLILFTNRALRGRLWLLWLGLFPLLLLSGERKALLIYLFLTAVLFVRGRLALMIPAMAAGFAGIIILSTLVDNPYLEKQLQTLIDPEATGQYNRVIATGEYAAGDTPSNVQRAFAFALTKDLVAKHPLMGVGTNQFISIIDTRFSYLPAELRLGIHGEFQRISTENGLIGLSLYALIWIMAWFRLRRVLRRALYYRLIGSVQARVLPLMFFVPCILYVGTEASGTRAFVTLMVISLLPELAWHGLCASMCGTRKGRNRKTDSSPPNLGRPLPENTR